MYTEIKEIISKTKTANLPNNCDVVGNQAFSVPRGTYTIDNEVFGEIDNKRKCNTCNSFMLINFEFCMQCGDINPLNI